MSNPRIPTRVEWLDHGVTVTTSDFPDEHEARWWVTRELGADALDDGRAWLVPAFDLTEERAS